MARLDRLARVTTPPQPALPQAQAPAEQPAGFFARMFGKGR